MVEEKLFVTSQKTINFLSISNNDLHVYTIHHFIDILEIFVSILWYILYEINVSFLMGYFIYFFLMFDLVICTSYMSNFFYFDGILKLIILCNKFLYLYIIHII